jgi:hypothetical protein
VTRQHAAARDEGGRVDCWSAISTTRSARGFSAARAEGGLGALGFQMRSSGHIRNTLMLLFTAGSVLFMFARRAAPAADPVDLVSAR